MSAGSPLRAISCPTCARLAAASTAPAAPPGRRRPRRVAAAQDLLSLTRPNQHPHRGGLGQRRRTPARRRRSPRWSAHEAQAHRGRRQPTVPPSSSPRQRAGRSLLARRGSRDTSGIASGVGQLWIAIAAPWLWPNSTIRVHTACCSSFHMSVSCGVVSPSGATAADSVMISPDPPCARAPRCTRCQRRPLPSPCADTWVTARCGS